jgi:nifR3 family TIM-barrel protein
MFNISQLKNPVIGLSPMDGVTDAADRFIIKKYGNPDIMYTEFTHVQGLCIAGDNLLHHFIYDEIERPIIGQIYGKEPEYFYHAAKMIAYLGFDGVDINMGCPAKTVTASGAGAGLIRTPDLAREIIAAVREGVKHWSETGKFTGLSNRTLKALEEMKPGREYRDLIPVSVKTRIGYDQPITESWISNLNQAKPDWLAVHGRTLKQMYTGEANWDELKIAVETAGVPVLVNGDIQTKEDLAEVLELTKAHGALIGRATYGNPWVFKELRMTNYELREEEKTYTPSLNDRFNVLLEHTQKFIEVYPDPKAFFQMRKHFGWYCKGFDGASETRVKLMQAKSIEDVREIISAVSI